MQTTAEKAGFSIELQLLEQNRLLEFSRYIDPDRIDETSLPEEMIETIVCNPRRAPLDAGYEITRLETRQVTPARFRVELTASIIDAQAVLAHACAAVDRDAWRPRCLGEAILEHVFFSNASPPPLDLGVVITGWRVFDEI